MKSEYTIKSMTRSATVTLAYARQHGKELLKVLAAIERAGVCGLTNAYMAESDMTIFVVGGKRELGNVWQILRNAGFSAPPMRPQSNESAWGGYFSKDGGARVFVGFSSSVCKRIQVSTETVTIERPVYEIQCDEETVGAL